MNNTLKFAEITVNVSCDTDYIINQCKDYISNGPAELNISVDRDDVAKENARADREGYPYGYLESLAFYRKFCSEAVYKSTVLFHSSAIALDGEAYLFAAPSGTGKSTHTGIWRNVFGDRAVMVNDDKPLIKIKKDGAVVYGTPWDGKHKLSNNISAPIKGICFLTRGKENSIKRLDRIQALPFLLAQTFRPEGEEGARKMLELALSLIDTVPMWQLSCNISNEAAVVAYEGMSGKKYKMLEDKNET